MYAHRVVPMTQHISFERIALYIVAFIMIFLIFLSAGYLAQADLEGRSGGQVISSPVLEVVASIQPIGIWYHSGSDPLLGPFEERLDLMSIGTFRSKILAPAFAEDPIIIRGFWRRGDAASIGLYVNDLMINEIRYDPNEQVFVNTEGYRYAHIGNRDTLERIRVILLSSLHPR